MGGYGYDIASGNDFHVSFMINLNVGKRYNFEMSRNDHERVFVEDDMLLIKSLINELPSWTDIFGNASEKIDENRWKIVQSSQYYLVYSCSKNFKDIYEFHYTFQLYNLNDDSIVTYFGDYDGTIESEHLSRFFNEIEKYLDEKK